MTARRRRAPLAFLALIGACIENTAPAHNDEGSALVVPDEGGDGDGDREDAGRQPVLDGGVAGTGRECAANAPKTPDNCYGFYCGTNYASVRAETPATSACGTDQELMMICEGPFPIALAECARDNAGEPEASYQAAVKDCVRQEDAWDPISDACLDCYLKGAACAKKECVIECLSGDSRDCDVCRETKGCTPDFYVCAMMPDPQ